MQNQPPPQVQQQQQYRQPPPVQQQQTVVGGVASNFRGSYPTTSQQQQHPRPPPPQGKNQTYGGGKMRTGFTCFQRPPYATYRYQQQHRSPQVQQQQYYATRNTISFTITFLS